MQLNQQEKTFKITKLSLKITYMNIRFITICDISYFCPNINIAM